MSSNLNMGVPLPTQPISSYQPTTGQSQSVMSVSSMPNVGPGQMINSVPVMVNSGPGSGSLVNHSAALSSQQTLSNGPKIGNSISPSGQSQFTSESQVLDKKRLAELVKEVDPTEQLDEDVEDILLTIADDFIEQTVSQACALARHRKATNIDVKDVQLVLERNWNMWIPGFGTEEIRPYKRSATAEAHKQRMGLIRKTLKKY